MLEYTHVNCRKMLQESGPERKLIWANKLHNQPVLSGAFVRLFLDLDRHNGDALQSKSSVRILEAERCNSDSAARGLAYGRANVVADLFR